MRRWTDPLVIAAISLGAWLAGRPWAGFNSPDSEFYASLALFGSDVADRSIDPAYTWTRLGYIAPVRGLTTVLGASAGFAVWRLVLIAFIVGSLYCLVRMASTRQLAVVVAAFSALNTVVMSYVGNSYLTGTIIAAITVLLALGSWQALGAPSRPWIPALLAGGVVGWLAMTNPYGMLLGLVMWLAIRIVVLVRDSDGRWRAIVRDAVVAAAGFIAVFGALLLAGRLIFPGRDWLGTYLEWNSKLDYSTFIGDASAWQRDLALLVPVVALIISVISVFNTTSSRQRIVATLAVVIAATNIGFTAIYLVVVPGPWLEAPTYVAKLWAGALVAVALAFAAVIGDRSLRAPGWVVAAVFAPLVLWAGRWDKDLDLWQGIAIMVVVCVLVVVAARVIRSNARAGAAILTMAAVGSFYLGAQIEQNGRGMVGSYGQFPFRAAYVDFDGDLLMSSKIAAEEWLLAQTTSDDRIGIWTDPDRLMASVAAMQLWGWYNNISSGPVLSPPEADALERARPSVIAMYAPERAQIEAFYSSLPVWSLPTPLECTTVPYLGVGNTNPSVCITHLRWA